jgi:hypothetical protein
MNHTGLILMGAWVRWIILNLLRPFGLVYGVCALIRLLYRIAPLGRRPIWTAVAAHTTVLLLIIWILGVVVCHLLEGT